jgi:hypothetical protein
MLVYNHKSCAIKKIMVLLTLSLGIIDLSQFVVNPDKVLPIDGGSSSCSFLSPPFSAMKVLMSAYISPLYLTMFIYQYKI